MQAFEREVILAELKRSHQNVSMAAKSLGLERSHLYKKAEQLGIDLRAMRREQDSRSDRRWARMTSQIIGARGSLFVDLAIFHYELDVFEQANICAIIKSEPEDSVGRGKG